MHKDLNSILISEEKICEIVETIAKKLDEDYKGEEVVFLVILKGSMPFASDLMRKVHIPVILDFMQVSSYGSASKSTGEIQIKHDISVDVEGKNLLIIEDIMDSGNTLFTLKNYLLKKNPKSLKICTLLDKPDRREADIKSDYVGAKIPDEFVVGYGLDYAERYRELPYVGILSRNIYE